MKNKMIRRKKKKLKLKAPEKAKVRKLKSLTMKHSKVQVRTNSVVVHLSRQQPPSRIKRKNKRPINLELRTRNVLKDSEERKEKPSKRRGRKKNKRGKVVTI